MGSHRRKARRDAPGRSFFTTDRTSGGVRPGDARKGAHLPAGIAQGVITYRELLTQFDRAMRAADLRDARKVYAEAYRLAEKLNGGTQFGVIAGEDAPRWLSPRSC